MPLKLGKVGFTIPSPYKIQPLSAVPMQATILELFSFFSPFFLEWCDRNSYEKCEKG